MIPWALARPGFSLQQIAGISALEFLSESDQASVELALEKCLVDGYSAIDASVITARGASLPHHFQGPRVCNRPARVAA